jgi:hypothetical protein
MRRRVDLVQATMEGWGRLDAQQRDRFFAAFVRAAVRLDQRALRAGPVPHALRRTLTTDPPQRKVMPPPQTPSTKPPKFLRPFARTYITALPDEEAALPEWHAAIEALMLVADLGGPTMFARIGMMRALNREGR